MMIFARERIEVALARLDLDDEAATQEGEYLTEDEKRRARQFRFPRDRKRFIVSRARLRQLLASRLDASPASIELQYGCRGKPELAGQFAASKLKFNVSHSEDLAVYAFTSGGEVGVDVELIRPLPDADDIATRFFSRAENAAYLALHPRDRPLGFFNCWTRKEAFIKAIGDGLYYPLDAFDVTLAPGAPAQILRVGSTPGRLCGWELASFSPAAGFVAAVVAQGVP
jgi:4'-phosphopantetheinyl transferase